MSGTTLLAKPGLELETALLERVGEAKARDPYAPITILVGSNLLGAYLRRTLAEREGGLFNVRFATFADMTAWLVGDAESGAGIAPRFADRVIVDELLSSAEASAGFGEAARTRGFGEALLSTFSDLSESGCTPDIARAIAADGAAEKRVAGEAQKVLALYARFRERLEGLGGDTQTRLLAAMSKPPAPVTGPVFAYGFYDFNEMQRRLLAHLALARDVTVLMPWGTEEPYRFVAQTRDRLEQTGFRTEILDRPAGLGGPAVKPKLLNVPGEEEEIREIVRRILTLATERDVRFGDVALILPSIEKYAPLCKEVFHEAGIPYYLHEGSHAGGSETARGAIQLLGIIGGAMERRRLIEFLVSAPLGSRGAGQETDRFSLWVRKSAEAGVTGERGWKGESAALVERLRNDAEGKEGDPAALAAALEVDAMIERILRSSREASGIATWGGLARLLAALVRELFTESDDREGVCAAIEGLASLEATGCPASLEAFSRLAETALAGTGHPVGRFGGEGVNILSLVQARGLTFKAVFIPGLAERVFPTAIRQDPFLNDQERAELNAISRGALYLSARSERLSEEALLFELARASARDELVCSYPRFEEGTGKERIPSSFLRFIRGYSIDGAHGDLLDHERVSRGASNARPPSFLSIHELDFERALEYRNGSGYLPDNIFFARGARLVRGRWGTWKFTPYDGVFSSKEATGELRTMLEKQGRRFAPTSLEAYAGCPFDYFLARVLGIDVLEEPERIVALTPPQRGILIHRILARLFGELKKRDLLPVSAAPAAEVFAIADEVVARFLEDFPKREPVGLPVFWEMEKRVVREAVRVLLEEERLEAGDFVPAHFERSFGREGDGIDVPYDCDGRTVLFYGRIDRIDTGKGGSYRVIDYKTGKLKGKDQDLAGGSALQLPIYLMAASRMLGLELGSGEARYRHVGPGEARGAVVFSGGSWDERASEFAAIIDTITRGIEHGLFFAPADEQGCRSCDVRLACPSGMSRLFAIKAANDGRVREYLQMRGVGEVEE
jgi:ATP-dependent helicase/nuclease subunit B